MRKIFTLGLFVLLVLSSCSKDDDTENSNSSDILVGTWEAVEEYDFVNGGDDTFPYEKEEETLEITKDRISFYSYGDVWNTLEYEYDASSNELITGSGIMIIEKEGNNKFILWNERKDLGSLYKRTE